MVDAHVSGTCEAIHGGSSPLLGTDQGENHTSSHVVTRDMYPDTQ